MALFFQRDAKVRVVPNAASGAAYTKAWDIPILEGFSFSQTTNSSEITLSEMQSTAGVSRRGSKQFNDSLAPVEWSFSTYVRPFISTTEASPADGMWGDGFNHIVDEPLWNALLSKTRPGETDDAIITQSAANLVMNAANSNKSDLGTLSLEFEIGSGVIYKLADAVVNSANVSFEVDGIATVEWSGFAASITEASTFTITAAANIYTQGGRSTDTTNFIRNRLTSLAVNAKDGGASDIAVFQTSTVVTAYTLTLTGGSFTIDNGITYLTPEELGVVNKPLEHVTGPRAISGSFTCYLASGTANSKEFFQHMTDTTALGIVTHAFTLEFAIGGTATAGPYMKLNMLQCNIEVPSHSVEDVISLETNFTSLQSDLESATPDDLTITTIGPAIASD